MRTLAAWLRLRGLRSGDWLFPSRSHPGDHLTTRQYDRLVDEWVALIGLDPAGDETCAHTWFGGSQPRRLNRTADYVCAYGERVRIAGSCRDVVSMSSRPS